MHERNPLVPYTSSQEASNMARKGTPPPDVEAVIERHVRVHMGEAVRNLESALAPLQERTVYRGSPIFKAVESAVTAARDAKRKVDGWQSRTAPQASLPLDAETAGTFWEDPEEEGRVAQAEADTAARMGGTS